MILQKVVKEYVTISQTYDHKSHLYSVFWGMSYLWIIHTGNSQWGERNTWYSGGF